MSAWDAGGRRADVVIVTALEEELEALRAVEAGAVPGSRWERVGGPHGSLLWFRSFTAEGGRTLSVAALAAADMGALAVMHALSPVVESLEPRCIAMCGVCAGRRKKVHLGDVIVAERLFFKPFAARASAECLLWFWRHHVARDLPVGAGMPAPPAPPAASAPGRPAADGDDGKLVAPGGEPAPRRHLYGREKLLRRLDQWLVEDATDRWVVVTGGPGMGKSAILAEWLRRRQDAGAFVAHHEIHRGRHGSGAAEIVSSLVSQIEKLFPDPQRVVRPESRLEDLLDDVSTNRLVPRGVQLVLLIDGLDECDARAESDADPFAAFLRRVRPESRGPCQRDVGLRCYT